MNNFDIYEQPVSFIEKLINDNLEALADERNTQFRQITEDTIQHLRNILAFKRLYPE